MFSVKAFRFVTVQVITGSEFTRSLLPFYYYLSLSDISCALEKSLDYHCKFVQIIPSEGVSVLKIHLLN